jgi:hypothetical protein
MKRTAGLEFPPRLFELYAATNNFYDVGSCDQIIDEVLRD